METKFDSKFTKIVATVGPASKNEEVLSQIILAGADVIRLNFSHGAWEDHKSVLSNVRKVSEELEKPIAVFQDLQGPKIRVGQLQTEFLTLKEGGNLILTTDELLGGTFGETKKVSIDYKNLHNEAQVGNRILLDDGLLELVVEKVEGHDISTRVINGGNLKPRKGVNFPHTKLNISALTDKDKNDLKFAFENELDYVALSFVRSKEDVRELIDLMLRQYGKRIPIIAKIEKPEALADIDNIIDTADAIMVARGDLGVETSPQEVPIIQKTIIRKCNISGKPVITATQMLESMINNPRPTRAEANDVANAILDGTDAIMLSAETASGKYPVEAVRMMKDIALQVESSDIFKRALLHKNLSYDELMKMTKKDTEEATSFATIQLSDKICAKYIATFTNSGNTARKISKYRPLIPIIAFSPIQTIIRRLALVWGVTPFELGRVSSVDELLEGAAEVLKFKNLVSEGDFVVITAGVPVGVSGSTNMIKVVKI
jgi:pyruvate kinase